MAGSREAVSFQIASQMVPGLQNKVLMTAGAVALAASFQAGEVNAAGFGTADMQDQQTVQATGETPKVIRDAGDAIGNGIKRAGDAISSVGKSISDSRKGGYEDPSGKKPGLFDNLSAIKLPRPSDKEGSPETPRPRF